MKRTPASEAELQQQRGEIRRALLRANTADVLVTCLAMALAVAAIVQAFRAEQSTQQAEAELWKSEFSQAQAARLTGQAGARFQSLAAIEAAARIRTSQSLRDEAIAALALSDVLDESKGRQLPSGSAAVFSSDSERYVISDGTGAAVVFRTADDVEVARFNRTNASPGGFRFSPDNQLLAAIYFDRGSRVAELAVWSMTNTAPVLRTMEGIRYGSEQLFDFSPDGKRIAWVGGDAVLRVAEIPSNSPATRFQLRSAPSTVRFHPDGGQLAVALGERIAIVSFPDGRVLNELTNATDVAAMAWRGDGQWLAAACFSGEIRIWETATGLFHDLRGHTADVTYVAFNYGGDLLVSTAYDGTSRFWEPTTGRFLFSTHRGYVRAFSRDDARVAFVRPRQGFGIWSFAHQHVYRTFAQRAQDAGFWSIDVGMGGKIAASINRQGLQLWDLASGTELDFREMNARSVLFVPGKAALLTSGATGPQIWPVIKDPAGVAGLGEPRWVPVPRKLNFEFADITADGKKLVAGVNRSEAWLVDLEAPANPIVFKSIRNISSVAISPDGRWVAAGSWYGDPTRVWDTSTGEVVHEYRGRSAKVKFSPDGRWLVAGTGDEYCFWQTGSWDLKHRIPRDTIGELTGPVAFTSDGHYVAIAPTQRTVRLIEPGSWTEIANFTPPDPRIISWLSFTPAGDRLVAASAGDIMEVWDIKNIRQALSKSGLDWQETVRVARASELAPARLAHIRSSLAKPSLFLCVALGGVALAILFAVFSWRRHRKLIETYEQIEQLVVQRNRQLEAAQREVLHSQKMKALGTLAAGIAHDFNNLLSVIRMSNKLVGRASKQNADIQENVQTIESAVQQGKEVVRSMLGYSREETPEPVEYSVPSLVEDVVALLNQEFLEGITLAIELDRKTLPVIGYPGRLQQILLNLIVNASEAMAGKGRLSIDTSVLSNVKELCVLRPSAAAAYVELSVGDSGPGIPPEIRERIFEPFFTTKQAGATRGTGLGLSLVYSLAQQDGLGISLDTAPGQGSVFRIYIPVTSQLKR